MKFICDAFLSFSRRKGVVTFRNLPHVRVYRYGLRLIQGHETHTVCHLQEDKMCASVRNYSIKKNRGYIFLLLYLGAHAREGTQSITSLHIWHGAQAIQPLGPMGVQYLFSTLL